MSIRIMNAVTKYGPTNSSHRFVLLMIADNAADDGSNSWPSVETLAEKTALSERTVIRAIQGLVRDGYLVRTRRKDTSNIYQIVMEKLVPVSDKLSPTVSDNLSPTQVTPRHPGKCHDVTLVGDTVSPDPSLNHPTNHPIEPETTATAPAADSGPPPAAVAAVPAPDPLPPILRWIGFSDRLTDKERNGLDPAVLLAWAYWVHLEEAKPTRPKNAVALARSQWRKGLLPPDDLLALALAWLHMADDGRRALLDALDFSARYGGDDPGLDDDFPGLPITAAIAIYRATGSALGPPTLMPIRQKTAEIITTTRAAAEKPAPPASTLWQTALADLENQMTRDTFAKWLRGTTAAESPDGLTIRVGSPQAIEWLQARLHPVIQRAVDDLAGRPLPVTYTTREVSEVRP